MNVFGKVFWFVILLAFVANFCSCNLFVCDIWAYHIVKDALSIFFKLSFVGFWLFFLLQMWMSWRAKLPKRRLHYLKLKNVWQRLLLKSKKLSWLSWKLEVRWRIKTITPWKKTCTTKNACSSWTRGLWE
jgi:hypothetical protein